MKRLLVTLMLSLLMVSPLSAQGPALRAVAAATESVVGALFARVLKRSSEQNANIRLTTLNRLINRDVHPALKSLGLPAHTTPNELVAKLNSLPITDHEDQAIRREVIAFLTNNDGVISEGSAIRNLGALGSLVMSYGGKGLSFPCPGCGTPDNDFFRVILHGEIEYIARTRIPKAEERIQLDNILNNALAQREIHPLLDSSDLADIPLEYKQIWALMIQVSNFGQGYFKAIADAVLDGMMATGKHPKDLFSSQSSIRFYRLLFAENFTREEVEIWTDIIKRFFQQESGDSVFTMNQYQGMNGLAAYAEKYYSSDMGQVFKLTGANEGSHSITKVILRVGASWEKIQGTVDHYVRMKAIARRANVEALKDLFDSSTIEVLENARTLMSRDINLFIEQPESPYTTDSFRNVSNSLEIAEAIRNGRHFFNAEDRGLSNMIPFFKERFLVLIHQMPWKMPGV